MTYRFLPEPKPAPKSAIVENVAKPAAAAGAAALSVIPGIFGNTAKGINDLVAAPIMELAGQKPVPYEQTPLGKILPTTEQHIKNFEEAIPFTKPTNEVQKFTQDIAKDAAELFGLGKFFKLGKYAFSGLRSFGISLGANTGGEIIKDITGSKEKGDTVKNGILMGLSLFNPSAAKQIPGALYNKAAASLPPGAKYNTNVLTTGLNGIENDILKGRPRNSISANEEWVLKQIDKVRGIGDDVEQLVAQKKSINDDLAKSIYEIPDRKVRNQMRNSAKQINGAIRNTMADYGKTNPAWWKLQKGADEAYGALAQSNMVSRTIEKHIKGRPEWLSHLFGIVPAGISYLSPLAGGAGAVAYQAAKIATRMIKSPDLRNHYFKTVGAAAAENEDKLVKSLDSFQQEVEKDKEKSKARYRILRH